MFLWNTVSGYIFFFRRENRDRKSIILQLQKINFSREMIKRPISFKCIKKMNTI